ncbi:MAG: hypothetical protein PVG39_01350 [Desulfobacteraceae bacterium]|jgi:hypothetical protein
MKIKNRNGNIVFQICVEKSFTFRPMEARSETGEGFLVVSLGWFRLYFPHIEYRVSNDDLWFYC